MSPFLEITNENFPHRDPFGKPPHKSLIVTIISYILNDNVNLGRQTGV